MNPIKFITATLLSCIIAFSAEAQSVSKKEIKAQRKKIDDEYLFNEDYNHALPLYLHLDSIAPKDVAINYRIGVCYLNSTAFNKVNALPYLQLVQSNYNPDVKNDVVNYELYYYLGRAYHLAYYLDSAINYFQKYKTFLKSDYAKLADANRQIEMCNTAKDLKTKPVEISIENLGATINSPYPEYSAVISTDESMLIFTSRRPGSTGNQVDEQGKYFEDIYISYKAKDKWTKPVGIDTAINTAGHEASVGVSVDGQQLVIYKDDKGDGNLYICNLMGDKWSKPLKLGATINTLGWEPSASLSSDENTIYFVSTRPGGFGGRDIYKSQKLPNGTWGAAQNLGNIINTPYDEDAPFIHPDGKTLYFSSTGHNSMGGFDIFKSVQNDVGIWQQQENVGYPINSTDDDVFYVLSANGKHAYYSSIKEGGYGEKDIYMLTLESEKEVPITVLKGTITGIPAPIDVQITVTDNETSDIVGSYRPNSKTGDYLLTLIPGRNYNVTYESAGFLFHSENIFIPDTTSYQVINKAVDLAPIKVGAKVVLKNIFFDFDKASLRTVSRVELNRVYNMLKTNPSLKIEISGHTDSKGSDEYNQKLSDERAKSVVKYLTEKGISADRMQAKGYGETRPVASNDTEEGRQENRRTELKIIEF